MKHLLLERKRSSYTETQGFLSFKGSLLASIERPWIEHTVDGGKPYESCVPVGRYDLRPHKRPNGDDVVALVNPDHGVYYLEDDLPQQGGRFLILIHVANYKKDVVGCIGPGLWKDDSQFGPMVKSSRVAMTRVMDYIDGQEAQLEIRWI